MKGFIRSARRRALGKENTNKSTGQKRFAQYSEKRAEEGEGGGSESGVGESFHGSV